MQADLGLTATAGGRHDGVGTHNRIVPLGGGSFIELLAIANPAEADRSELGAQLMAAIARGDGLISWAVAVDDVGAIASRLGTEVTSVGRQGMTARLTAVAEALVEPFLPFFIERRGAPRGPGATDAAGIDWIEVGGDPDRLGQWLGGVELPVRVVDGPASVRALGVGGRVLRVSQVRR